MSVASGQHQPRMDSPEGVAPRYLIDLTGLDLSQRLYARKDIERFIPHRGDMLLIDSIVWENAEHTQGVAVKHIRDDEFWVKGHFPDRPMLPAVLMIEAAAQLACFLYNIRMPEPKIVAFVHLDNASFRAMVQPGDDLYVLCSETKFGRRRFVSDVQGVVKGKVAFEASISGMNVDPEHPRQAK